MHTTALRNHTCGELTKADISKEVTLCGWCQNRRDHGGLIFVDLRDRYGITQLVFSPKLEELFHRAERLKREDVIQATGRVIPRKKDAENPNLITGEIEVEIKELNILNRAHTPPFEIEDRIEANMETRLKYRYLDLRRPIMAKRLVLRHNVASAARKFLSAEGFVEIETPLLVKATPEGARDYIVPSRVNPGDIYSLPQSPQLYKQILMVAGIDRYFQLAKCLRDEDLRSDRQPEFTQIDIEMSFVEEEDIISLSEHLIKKIWKEAQDIELKIPFQRMSYAEAMNSYGSDKPDMRFGLKLFDVTDIVKNSDFTVFKPAECVKCINPPNINTKDLERYIEFVKAEGGKGMAWMRVTEKGLESNIVKYFSHDIQKELIERTKAKPGSVLMFVADRWKNCAEVLSKLRLELGKNLGMIDPKEYRFIWITHFPLFEHDEELESWKPMHHIFSMPNEESLHILDKDPGKVTGRLYDLTLNGVELGGGSIRIHKKELQEQVLRVIGMSYEQAEERFGFLLNSFKYGAPPHGGIAFGLDRICALLSGIGDIREVIAFPKNKNAECPMDGCPSPPEDKQMKELHLKFEGIRKKPG